VPYMSRETLEYHHDKHHLAYVNNGNNLAKSTECENKLGRGCERDFRQEPGTVQQYRTTLQPHSFLEMDEAGR
jgi:superoxide dismutase